MARSSVRKLHQTVAVLVVLSAGVPSLAAPQSAATTHRIAFAIHGGAGVIRRDQMTPALEQEYRVGLTAALSAGYAILQRGGSSLDAVEAAIRTLEDDSLFNAGKGAVFTADGTNELDAAIMDGGTLRAGAVAGLTHVKNPITLARRVMEQSPYVMLIGAGAEAFAATQGMELVPPHYFFTQRRWEDYQRAHAAERARDSATHVAGHGTVEREPSGAVHYGTVGAVALDRAGNLAAGTSTGGTSMKRWGRVGDSPIIGAGTYANNASCAVSATGHGEDFIRHTVASDICARVRYGRVSLAKAAEDVVLRELAAQPGADGGVIALDRTGAIAMPFNTPGMFRAYMTPDGIPVVKIYSDE